MPQKSKPQDVDAYLATLDSTSRPVAEAIRAAIKRAVPKAEEAISYGIPTYRNQGKAFLYFAAWKKHIGLYPVYEGSEAFEAKIGPYRAKEATVQFRYSEPLPEKLIEQIARAQAKPKSA